MTMFLLQLCRHSWSLKGSPLTQPVDPAHWVKDKHEHAAMLQQSQDKVRPEQELASGRIFMGRKRQELTVTSSNKKSSLGCSSNQWGYLPKKHPRARNNMNDGSLGSLATAATTATVTTVGSHARSRSNHIHRFREQQRKGFVPTASAWNDHFG